MLEPQHSLLSHFRHAARSYTFEFHNLVRSPSRFLLNALFIVITVIIILIISQLCLIIHLLNNNNNSLLILPTYPAH